jgi:hypothetical protein
MLSYSQYFVNFPLGFPIYFYRRWRFIMLAWEWVVRTFTEPVRRKNWVNLNRGWKINPVRVAYLL